jgi:hypothetical protein
MNEPRVKTEAELVELVRGIDVRAPQRLHDRVQELVDAAGQPQRAPGGAAPRSRPRLRLRLPLLPALGGAVATAAAAVAIVLATTGGGGAALTVASASAPTLANATGAAPAESTTDHARLTAAVQGVAFPYWEDSLGWRTVGARQDRIGGRDVGTVYYMDAQGRRIGYAIVAGTAPAISGGTVWHHRGTEYRVLRLHGAQAIAWLRDGHLCIVSGRGVDSATLLHLASWAGHGQVA